MKSIEANICGMCRYLASMRKEIKQYHVIFSRQLSDTFVPILDCLEHLCFLRRCLIRESRPTCQIGPICHYNAGMYACVYSLQKCVEMQRIVVVEHTINRIV